MGEVTRQPKYDEFWKWVGRSNASDEFSAAIDMLLHTLTDTQLDEVLADITAAGGFPDASD